MDNQLQVRLSTDKKERFVKTAKENGSDASTLVREFIDQYLEEYEKKEEEGLSKETVAMWNAGYDLQQKVGIKSARVEASKIIRFGFQPDKFVEEVIALLVANDLIIPKELLQIKDHPQLAQIFVAGLIGEERM